MYCINLQKKNQGFFPITNHMIDRCQHAKLYVYHNFGSGSFCNFKLPLVGEKAI